MLKGQSQMLKWFIIIMVLLLVSQGGYAGFRIMSVYPAYMTGYQGAHARFYGVRYQEKSYKQGLWDTTSVIEVASDQTSSAVGEEVVVLNLKRGVYFGLDRVGARVWELVQQPRTFGELVNTVVDEFEVSASACESDLRSFLLEMAEAGLVTVADGESDP